jgi:hypothetical protein
MILPKADRRGLLVSTAVAMALLVAAIVTPSARALDCETESSPQCFALQSVGVSLSDTRAGAHPDITTSFKLAPDPESQGGIEPYSRLQNLTVKLPPGLTGNPNAVPQCDPKQLTTPVPPFNYGDCPNATQVGVTEVLANGNPNPLVEAVYNMEPPGGDVVARLGFIAAKYPFFISLVLRPGDYGVTAKVEGAPSIARVRGGVTTLWGVPADPSHDTHRPTPFESQTTGGAVSPPHPPGISRKPFITNPTSCGSPGEMEITATTYEVPGLESTLASPFPEIEGCANLGFSPRLTVTPTTREAASPTGLDAELTIPQDESPDGFATAEMRNATVTLPAGMTIAPGAADGLQACSAAQAGFEPQTDEAAHCPDAAKLGSATIVSPALRQPLQGAIYQRTPEPGKLLRIWLIADGLGVHLKIPGEVHADPLTGQLTSVFTDTPQQPVEDIQLHFKGGSRAPLATPASCGTYRTQFIFDPWSGGSPASGDTPMTIDEGCGTGGFAPKLSAGSTAPSAGAFSPFVTKVTRESGEQNIAGLDVTLPPGVLAKLAGVPLCVGAAAESGACPAASQVGTTSVAAGPGPSPLWIPQPGKDPTAVYISGPYRGAPYSLVVKTPAQAGPFDLGTVVVRAGIYVDPETAVATVRSDALPQLLEGIPISYRTIQVDVNRSEFTLNPTNCDPLSTSARLTSEKGAIANTSDGFKAVNCAKLGFKPKLGLKLVGGTRRGAHPALRAVLRPRPGDANIAAASVALPHSEFLDQAHIGTVCTRVQFAAGQCPARSIYGHAKAFTPLLDKPLEGPVYLRSSSHQLPDLVADLNGQIQIALAGRIDSINGGIRSRFEAVPDAPVSKFILAMKGGKKGLIVNSRNICTAPGKATLKFDGQNGRAADQAIPLSSDCNNGGGKSPKRRGSRSGR